MLFMLCCSFDMQYKEMISLCCLCLLTFVGCRFYFSDLLKNGCIEFPYKDPHSDEMYVCTFNDSSTSGHYLCCLWCSVT
jgi:hypothetical protein